MTTNRIIVTLVVLLSSMLTAAAQYTDFPDHKEILSFEQDAKAVKALKKSSVDISPLHSKLGENSLLWKWKKEGAGIEIPGIIPYLPENPNPKETSVSTFVFWVYSETPVDGKLKFSFMKGDSLCCQFSYGLDFKGWRGAWVAFDRDMEGTPAVGMDKVIITAPENVKKGRLFFDGIITSAFEDVRHHTADFQAPFINKETTMHWLVLLNSWEKALDITPDASVSAEDIAQMETVRERFITLVTDGKKVQDAGRLREQFAGYGITENKDGSIKGKPIFFTRYGETYINVGIPDASKIFSDNGQLLRAANDFMFNLALAYLKSDDPAWKDELAGMYITMTRHMLDQGYAAGSALGTLHHLGYSMRNFYTAPVMMKDVLEAAGLADEVQQAMEWFSGVGEVKTAPVEPGMDIDAFNTSLMGRTAALLMLEDSPYKKAYMQALSRWIDNGFRYAEGFKPAFKPDGTVQHHRKAYPAYATGGFDGAVNAVWMLHGTDYAISETGHNVLKKALLEMRFYCNKKSFPLAMSGRHPDGNGALIPEQYGRLADAGSPDGTSAIDRELAEAYLRLDADGRWSRQFTEAGFTAEDSPTGCHSYPFNCSLTYRQDDWSVTIAGHSRYLWSAEIYNGANHYGRYLTHGSMQILADGSPEISCLGSGYQVAGWDWCHIPGATAAEIPMEAMKADVKNVDEFSGYEEMLLSDEWFAGGVTHKGNAGAYAMILHEHDKYNGSLRARKSYFAFDNRVIALGSDLENFLPGSSLHTTLFQNVLNDPQRDITGVNGGAIAAREFHHEYEGDLVTVRDRFGNTWFVKDAKVAVERGLQKSFHEETDAPTEGYFEKAYICHGDIVSKGAISGNVYMKDSYEYMTVVHATEAEIVEYSEKLPYTIIRCDSKAHIIRDDKSGIISGAVFEELDGEDTAGETSRLSGIVESSPCMVMMSRSGAIMTLSASNPDLNLYEGESDEVFDGHGDRVERSVYGREWIDNPCGETGIDMKIQGRWKLENAGNSDVTVKVEGNSTRIHFTTREARTEEIQLSRIIGE